MSSQSSAQQSGQLAKLDWNRIEIKCESSRVSFTSLQLEEEEGETSVRDFSLLPSVGRIEIPDVCLSATHLSCSPLSK